MHCCQIKSHFLQWCQEMGEVVLRVWNSFDLHRCLIQPASRPRHEVLIRGLHPETGLLRQHFGEDLWPRFRTGHNTAFTIKIITEEKEGEKEWRYVLCEGGSAKSFFWAVTPNWGIQHSKHHFAKWLSNGFHFESIRAVSTVVRNMILEKSSAQWFSFEYSGHTLEVINKANCHRYLATAQRKVQLKSTVGVDFGWLHFTGNSFINSSRFRAWC